MYNKVVLVGNLTKDPQGKFLPSGAQSVELSLAYNRRYRVGDEVREETHYFDIRAYGKLAEKLLSNVSKGYTVLVEGRLSQDRWTDSDGKNRSKVYIVALDVRVLRKPKLANLLEEEAKEDMYTSEEEEKIFGEDDEIPF